ncbi:hypothetical protein [Nonomuraea insulae]|uniref:Uncharacterized protein n=1 Tax=Nonomuraea insulae TaxID=1616787 RepID=A0ABW1D9D5_9ACTN
MPSPICSPSARDTGRPAGSTKFGPATCDNCVPSPKGWMFGRANLDLLRKRILLA